MKVKNTDALSDAVWEQQLLEDRLEAVTLLNQNLAIILNHTWAKHEIVVENMVKNLDRAEDLWNKVVKFTDVDDKTSYKHRTKAFLDIVDYPEHLDYERTRQRFELAAFENNLPYTLAYLAWRIGDNNKDDRIPWMFRKAKLAIRNAKKN